MKCKPNYRPEIVSRVVYCFANLIFKFSLMFIGYLIISCWVRCPPWWPSIDLQLSQLRPRVGAYFGIFIIKSGLLKISYRQTKMQRIINTSITWLIIWRVMCKKISVLYEWFSISDKNHTVSWQMWHTCDTWYTVDVRSWSWSRDILVTQSAVLKWFRFINY